MRLSRPRSSELLLPAAVGLVGVVEIVAAGYDPLWLALATYALGALALCALRIAPLAVPLLVGGVYAVAPALGFDVSEPASWVVLIAVASFGTGAFAAGTARLAGLASVSALLAIVYATLEWQTDFEPSILFGLVVTVGAWAIGRTLREALDRNRLVGAQAERVRLDRAHAATRAARAERRRIAGELHDVLAHALGAMVIQSAVARDRIAGSPGEAAETLRAVAQSGRDALTETGRLLRLLRDERDELGLGAEAGSEAPAEAAREHKPRALAPPLRDLALPAILGVLATGEVILEDYGVAPAAASIAASWLAAAALCARRRFPTAMPIAVTAIVVGSGLAGAEAFDLTATIALLALACYSGGLHAPRPRTAQSLAAVLASLALLALDTVARGDVTADVVFVLGLVGAWVAGVALRETLRRTRELAAEGERERLAQVLEAERATVAERRRIARELHDVLANSFSVMVVQASLAADLAESDPASATRAASEVERSGRNALGELGTLLRRVGDGTDEVGAHPQHGVVDLPALAEEYGRAGLRVQLELDHVVPLPMSVDLSTYRIVQEGLTNALKHAPGSPVRVRLERCESDLAIEVRNGPAARSRTAAGVPSGHGLAGVHERVALFDGQLEAKPTDDGGFVLSAMIPLAPEAA